MHTASLARRRNPTGGRSDARQAKTTNGTDGGASTVRARPACRHPGTAAPWASWWTGVQVFEVFSVDDGQSWWMERIID